MKKSLGLGLTLLGAGALIYGVIAVFTGKFMEPATWVTLVLGLVFFTSGIGLLKSS